MQGSAVRRVLKQIERKLASPTNQAFERDPTSPVSHGSAGQHGC